MSSSVRSPGRDAWPPFTGQRRDLSGAPQSHGHVSPTGSGNASPYAAGHKYQDANFASRMHPGAMPPPPCFNGGGYNHPLPPSSTPATPAQSGMLHPAHRGSVGPARSPAAAMVSTPARVSLAQYIDANTIYATGGPSEGTDRFIPPAEDIRAGQEEEAARLARLGLAGQPSARPPPQGAGQRPEWPLSGPAHPFHSQLFENQLNALDAYSAAKINRVALARALLTVPVPASY
ncbi:hypothetical protein EV121DRAFT_293314 [Schizophyllum commune]